MSVTNMICIISISLGYLIGSALPAYYFGRLAGVDIRHEGAKYAGTINVYHVVGKRAAVATAIFDLAKGFIAIQMALAFGVSFPCAQITGFAAIAGHVMPFYLNFRGGQGVACATGILLYYLFHYISAGALYLQIVLFLAIIVFIFAYVARHGEVVSAVILPVMSYAILIHAPNDIYNPYLLLIALYIIIVGIYNIVTRRLLIISDDVFKRYWWRTALRPAAILFIFYYEYHSKKATLFLIGFLGLFFLLLDFVRIVNQNMSNKFSTRIQPLFKQKEKGHFSSITLFLISAFLAVLFFNKIIAITSLLFLIFGDLFSKIFGLAYGRTKIYKKTIEGSLAYLGAALICIYVLTTTLQASFTLLFIGAMAATIVEALPLPVDDNFSVALLSGIVMTIIQNIIPGF